MSFFKNLKNAVTGSDDLKRASKAQREGLLESREFINRFSDMARDRLSPYTGAGEESLNAIMELLRNPESIRDDPGFRFSMDEALKGVNRTANAGGGGGVNGRLYAALQDRSNLFVNDAINQKINRFGVPLNIGANASNSLSNIDLSQGQLLSGNATDIGQSKANRFTNKFNFKQNLLGSFAEGAGRVAAGGGK